MTNLVLHHGRASTCSKKVRMALYEKGVTFESHLLDLQKFEQHQPEYLAINPKGVVPTLVHNGHAITESSIIIEYVDEAFPGVSLSPIDLVARASMRHWLRFSDEVAYKAVYAPTWQYMRHRAAGALEGGARKETLSRIPTAERRQRWEQMARGGYTEAELEASVRQMEECLDTLQAQLSRTRWLVGDAFTLADIAVLPFADRIRNLRPELLDMPSRAAIRRWLEEAAHRTSFNRAIDFIEDPRAHELPNI